jgi:hypothetical protein
MSAEATETHDEWWARVNGPLTLQRRELQRFQVAHRQWTPRFEAWRHGGWYVSNICYPSGASGCVSANYSDKKWRIVCENTGPGTIGDVTYASRKEAAYAELALVLALPEEFVSRDGTTVRVRP